MSLNDFSTAQQTLDSVAHLQTAVRSNQTIYNNKLQHNIFIIPGLILSRPGSMRYSYSELQFSLSRYHGQLPGNMYLSCPPILVCRMMQWITASILKQQIQRQDMETKEGFAAFFCLHLGPEISEIHVCPINPELHCAYIVSNLNSLCFIKFTLLVTPSQQKCETFLTSIVIIHWTASIYKEKYMLIKIFENNHKQIPHTGDKESLYRRG